MKSGDTVECIDNNGKTRLEIGTRYTVEEVYLGKVKQTEYCTLKEIRYFNNPKKRQGYFTSRFKVIGSKEWTLKEVIAQEVINIRKK